MTIWDMVQLACKHAGDPEAGVTQLLGLDFNGTINSHVHWEPDGFGKTDVTVIRMAHQRGHVVYVLTANSPRKVARALRDHGILAKTDRLMRRRRWNGGRRGNVVLVTHRKLDGTRLLVDDRAFCFKYGQPASLVIRELETKLAETPVI